MRHSVIRRSLYNGTFFVAGHVLYYTLVVTVNAKVDPVAFGRFYLGWAILNILAAPGGVLALSLSGHFAEIFRLGGTASAVAALGQLAAKLMPWALALAVATDAVLLISGRVLGADSTAMILLLPFTALTSVLVECVRAMFQGMLRFVWFGASWLGWCFVQFAFSVVGLVLVGAPWVVFLGMLTANCLTLIVLLLEVRRIRSMAATTTAAIPPVVTQSLWPVLPLCVALGGFVLLNNADVLVAYLTLSGAGLGAYSASAVLPKAIVTATHAVSQVILPVATHIRSENASLRGALAKAIALTFALAAFGALSLELASDMVCGGRFGIKFCDPALLPLLAGAAVAVSVIRTALIADVLGGRRWRPYVSIVGLAAFAAAGRLGPQDGFQLARSYTILCWLLLIVLAAWKLVDWRCARRPPLAAKEAARP